jgi:hypothetical protein
VRKAQYFRNKNFLLENRFGTGLQQVQIRTSTGLERSTDRTVAPAVRPAGCPAGSRSAS